MKLNTASLKDVEFGFPVVADGVYHAQFLKPEVKENKQKDGNNLVLVVKILDNPLTLAANGNAIENKGQIKLTRYLSLKPTPDYNPDQRLKEIAVAIKHPADADLNLEDIEGKLCMVKVTVRGERDKEGGGKYPPSNDVDRFTPLPDGDNFVPPPF